MTLNTMIEEKDEKMNTFMEKILIKRLKNHPEVIESILADIKGKWPIEDSQNSEAAEFVKNKKQKTSENAIDELRKIIKDEFITDSKELEKFKPNDMKKE